MGTTINQLNPAGAVSPTDLLPLTQGATGSGVSGRTRKVPLSLVQSLLQARSVGPVRPSGVSQGWEHYDTNINMPVYADGFGNWFDAWGYPNTGQVLVPLQRGLVATGTNLASALLLGAEVNRFNSVPPGTGTKLPSFRPYKVMVVLHGDIAGGDLTIYPPDLISNINGQSTWTVPAPSVANEKQPAFFYIESDASPFTVSAY